MVLFATYCSAEKDGASGDLPAIKRYTSDRILGVAAAARGAEARFGILSGQFGLISADHPLPYYDHLLQPDEITERAASAARTLADWGIPTAAATLMANRARASLGGLAQEELKLVASGGIQDPLQAVKALALGADLVGVARPLLQALLNGGEEGAERYLQSMISGLRQVIMLTGAKSLSELRKRPMFIGPALDAWGGLSLSSAPEG